MTSYQSNRNGLRLALPPGVDPSSFATPATRPHAKRVVEVVRQPTPTPVAPKPDDDEPTSTASPEEF